VAARVATQAPPPPAAAERARLLTLQRDASAGLRQAQDAATAPADVRRLVAAAAERLEALGADPPPSTEPVIGSTPALDPDLRAELRDTAGRLRRQAEDPAADPGAGIDGALALLDRARVRLEGEVALGLTLQGSYSQTPPREPVYGGHASAMGPPPPPSPGEAADPGPSPVVFEEAARLPTRTFGGGPTKDHILESTGSGVALFDYDGDGLLDIYLVTAPELTADRRIVPHRNALYRNLGGWRFEDVSAGSGLDVEGWGSGACAGDADGDGRLDLYVTNWGKNRLFRNLGGGRFEDIAETTGVAAGGWSTGCAFFDADSDGDLDLYVARYVRTTEDDLLHARRTLVWRNGPHIMVGPAGLPGESDLFFENVGNGRFVEAGQAFGLVDPAAAYGFAVLATDYDGDGLVDLFVANDSNPNFLFRNLGGRRFENVAITAGVGVNGEARAQAGMGADAGDVDGDGRMDLILTAFAHDNDTLYRNLDGSHFEDATQAAGLRAATFDRMGWGVGFLDADLDGSLDLAVVNGHIFADIDDYPALGESYRQTNQLFVNRGGHLADVSRTAGSGFQIARVGRGLAVGDLDNDGDLDLVVSNMDDPPTLLENRQRTGHHWLSIAVRSATGNRFGIGARVTVSAGALRQVREIRSGGSYLSQGDLRAFFGLGEFSGTVDVEVRLPGGARWRWQGLRSDRHLVLDLTDDARVREGPQ
jgi:hypothetical protein